MITVFKERFALAQSFVISRGAKTHADVIRVALTRDGVTGQGEAVPYALYGETMDSVAAQIAGLPGGIDRAALQSALPAGAARNAVDCALWDWAAKRAGCRVWDLAGLAAPGPEPTAYTLSLGPPDVMEAAARTNAHRPVLKIKLGTPDDLPRLRAVRRGAPAARIILDANEGWSIDDYIALVPHLADLRVALVEQPLPAGADDALRDLPRPVPICADESVHIAADLPALAGKYDMVNIKLDKAGGLTAALALRAAAREQGFGIMVGCMVATSLAMAPAVLLAQGAGVVDLDGPLLLAEDRDQALQYDHRGVHPPAPGLWG